MVELIASQAGVIQDYAQVASSMWFNSRHSENFGDVAETIKQQDISRLQKLGAFACLAPMAWALGPGNEMTLGLVAGKALENTNGNIAKGVIAVSATTATMEALAGLGTANILHKFNSATDVIRDRYLAKPKESTEDVSERKSRGRIMTKLGRAFGIVALTGTGSTGASLDYSLHDSKIEGRNTRTKKMALASAGMLATINAGYASAILGITKGAESAGIDSATDKVASVISNPLLIGGILAGAVATKGQYDLYKVKRSVDKPTDVPINESSDLIVENQLYGAEQ